MTTEIRLPYVQCPWLSKEEAENKNYRPYAGYFLPSEYHMIPNFEKDLIAAKKDYVAVSGNIRGIMLYVR